MREQRGKTNITVQDWTLAQSTQLETAVCFGASLRAGVGRVFI